jgi:hypothetical protein
MTSLVAGAMLIPFLREMTLLTTSPPPPLRYIKIWLFLCAILDVEMALSSLIIMPRVPKDFAEVLFIRWFFYFVYYLSLPKSSKGT